MYAIHRTNSIIGWRSLAAAAAALLVFLSCDKKLFALCQYNNDKTRRLRRRERERQRVKKQLCSLCTENNSAIPILCVCAFLPLRFLFSFPFSFSFGLILFDQPRFLFCAPHKKPNHTECQDCAQWNSEKWVSEQSQLLVVVVYNLSYVICYVECIREKRENARLIFFPTHNERHQQREWEQKSVFGWHIAPKFDGNGWHSGWETKIGINWRETMGMNGQRESFNADPIHPYEKLLIGLFKHKEEANKWQQKNNRTAALETWGFVSMRWQCVHGGEASQNLHIPKSSKTSTLKISFRLVRSLTHTLRVRVHVCYLF